MPKIVDHDERREALCLAAAKLIHAKGLEAATVRAIAREAGCSTGVLAHYFRDKDELLAHVLSYVNRRPIGRVLERLDADPSPGSMASWVAEVLPIDDERRMEWSVRLAIWGVRPDLQSFAPPGERSWLEGSRDLVEMAQLRGFVPASRDPGEAASQLAAVIMGASLCALFEPARFDETWLRRFVAVALDDAFRSPTLSV